MTTRMAEGARQERARFLLWLLPSFLVSRGTRERAGTPLAKSKEKKRLLAIIIFLKVLEVMNSKHKLR